MFWELEARFGVRRVSPRATFWFVIGPRYNYELAEGIKFNRIEMSCRNTLMGTPLADVASVEARLFRSSRYALLTSLALICPPAWAAEAIPLKLYEVTTETGMPHLEENLRYATTQEERCLSHQDLASAFPILQHHSLNACKLGQETRHKDALTYLLVCEAAHGKTGMAHWHLGGDQLTGRLDVRMGGKNMTFFQRVVAKPVGECVSEAK